MKEVGDTSRRAGQVQLNIFKQMTPEGRLQAAMDLAQTSRELLAEGVLKRHPKYNRGQAKLGVIRLLLGEELFVTVYPAAQDIHP